MGFLAWARSVIDEGKEPPSLQEGLEAYQSCEVCETYEEVIPEPEELYAIDYEYGVSDELWEEYHKLLEEKNQVLSRPIFCQKALERKDLSGLEDQLSPLSGDTTLDEVDDQRNKLEALKEKLYSSCQSLFEADSRLRERLTNFPRNYDRLIYEVKEQFPYLKDLPRAIDSLIKNSQLRTEARKLVPGAGNLSLAELAPKILNHHNRLLVEEKISFYRKALEEYYAEIAEAEITYQEVNTELLEYGVEIEELISQQNRWASERSAYYSDSW